MLSVSCQSASLHQQEFAAHHELRCSHMCTIIAKFAVFLCSGFFAMKPMLVSKLVERKRKKDSNLQQSANAPLRSELMLKILLNKRN